MPSLTVLLAPLALVAAGPAAETVATPRDGIGWERIVDAIGVPPAHQVRTEQRLVIRVAPLGPTRDLLADLPTRARPARLRERKIGQCLPAAGIVGVEIDADDRLLLFMRDQRLISASLERACQARDFYSGFYIERSADGRLCVERDLLHARTGAACTVSRLRQLVPEDD